MSSSEEIEIAVRQGADSLGFVGPMPSGAGIVSNDFIADTLPKVSPPVMPWLLTQEIEAKAIAEHVSLVGTNAVQLVRHVTPEVYPTLRALIPTLKIVQVIHVEGEDALSLVEAYDPLADVLLLDSGSPSSDEFGGTGRTHNWAVSRALVEAAQKPVFLAGGLNPGNVQAAIETVKPYGVDICSGLRTDDRLDEQKVAAFFAAIRQADGF